MYCVYGNSGWYIHGGPLFGGGLLLGGSVIEGSTVFMAIFANIFFRWCQIPCMMFSFVLAGVFCLLTGALKPFKNI